MMPGWLVVLVASQLNDSSYKFSRLSNAFSVWLHLFNYSLFSTRSVQSTVNASPTSSSAKKAQEFLKLTKNRPSILKTGYDCAREHRKKVGSLSAMEL